MSAQACGPTFAGVDINANLLESLQQWVERDPDRVVAMERNGDQVVDWTAQRTAERVRAVAKGLVACGVEPGERVALMAHTRLDWMIADLAIMSAGAVTVPVYETSSGEQLGWILEDSGAVVAIVENDEMCSMFDSVHDRAQSCREVVTIEPVDGQRGLDRLVELGAGVDDDEIDRRVSALGADDLATVIYTSGTTGRPKGCMLTHRNLCANVAQIVDAIGSEIGPDDSALLFLPLAHSLTKGTLLFCLEMGLPVGFTSNVARLPEELSMMRPSVIAAVPRIFEKVHNAAHRAAHSTRKGPIFDRAESVAVRWSKEHHAGSTTPWTAAEHWLFDRLVYGKLRQALGGAMRFAFSGGGPLGVRLTHFFDGAGVCIYEGYGLTETSPTLTINRPGAWRPGSVGRPVAGTTIRIAADGEVLATGPQVFPGYWRNAEATAEVIDDDGWFHTGDIGELDDEGFLTITGRKKELLVTAAGKNVAPAPLEDRLRSHPFVSQAVVLGDQRPFIAALVTIDDEVFAQWAQEVGLAATTVAEMTESAQLREVVREAVDEANESVSRAESIREFVILPRDLTIEADELTPTLKVRRAVVLARYESAIESIYGT
ncbi:MAG TPA: long-chain fatty acid--CoA ligase [Ilumatobacteraceae bacterium]|nr:long-chain fatty acid--CoA ligase [Ilumatobacteraceae bacterium]